MNVKMLQKLEEEMAAVSANLTDNAFAGPVQADEMVVGELSGDLLRIYAHVRSLGLELCAQKQARLTANRGMLRDCVAVERLEVEFGRYRRLLWLLIAYEFDILVENIVDRVSVRDGGRVALKLIPGQPTPVGAVISDITLLATPPRRQFH